MTYLRKDRRLEVHEKQQQYNYVVLCKGDAEMFA